MSSLPAIINSLPAGYLDLLGLKTMGRNPTFPVDAVAPVMEMLQWYASSQSEIVAGTPVNRAAIGQTVTDLVVPATETWLVLSAVTQVAAAVGVTSSRVQGYIQNSNALGTFGIFPSDVGAPTVNGAVWLPHRYCPFFMRPGDAFVANLELYAGAGNVTFQPIARIARLGI